MKKKKKKKEKYYLKTFFFKLVPLSQQSQSKWNHLLPKTSLRTR